MSSTPFTPPKTHMCSIHSSSAQVAFMTLPHLSMKSWFGSFESWKNLELLNRTIDTFPPLILEYPSNSFCHCLPTQDSLHQTNHSPLTHFHPLCCSVRPLLRNNQIWMSPISTGNRTHWEQGIGGKFNIGTVYKIWEALGKPTRDLEGAGPEVAGSHYHPYSRRSKRRVTRERKCEKGNDQCCGFQKGTQPMVETQWEGR